MDTDLNNLERELSKCHRIITKESWKLSKSDLEWYKALRRKFRDSIREIKLDALYASLEE